MMGGFDDCSEAAEAEQSNNSRARLPLFNPPPMMHSPSPERPSGMLTPPLHTPASVPFQWEEEPGKPRPCTALVAFSNPTNITPKCLELPPRLLEGPTYVSSKCCQSPYGSFGAERVQLGDMVLKKGVGMKQKGCFGSWRGKRAFKVRREVSGGSYVFPSSSADRDDTTDDDDHVGITEGGSHKKLRVTKMKGSGSFYNLFQSKLWTKICEGLKQVAPWRKY